MITYRDFTIGYNGFAFAYTPLDFDGPEDKRAGVASSLEDAMRFIDDYHFETACYPVAVGETVIKFDWLTDALTFIFSNPHAVPQFNFDGI